MVNLVLAVGGQPLSGFVSPCQEPGSKVAEVVSSSRCRGSLRDLGVLFIAQCTPLWKMSFQ